MTWRSKSDGSHYRLGGSGRVPKGRPGKASFVPKKSGLVHDAGLLSHGYNLREGDAARHTGLERCVKADGYDKTRGRLGALMVVNRDKKVQEKIQADRRWMRGKYRS